MQPSKCYNLSFLQYLSKTWHEVPFNGYNFHFSSSDFYWVNCPWSLKTTCWFVWLWMLETLTKPRAVCCSVFRPTVFNSKLSERALDLYRISHWQVLLCYCFVQYSLCLPPLYLGVMDSGQKVSLREDFCFSCTMTSVSGCSDVGGSSSSWLYPCQETYLRWPKPINIKLHVFLLFIQPTRFVPASQIKMAFYFLH